MKRLFSLLLLSFGSIFAGTPDDSVLSLRELISQTNIKLHSGIVPNRNDLGRIRAILEDDTQFESYKTDGERLADIKELSEQFSLFEKLCSSNESSDSCLNVFKNFRMKFNTLFGVDIHNKIINSRQLKILLFSTSMSCECTLKSCAQQEDEIQRLYKESPDLFEYAVIDGYAEPELVTKYGAAFFPTVIVLDDRNNEIKIYELGDSVYEKLLSLLRDYERGTLHK